MAIHPSQTVVADRRLPVLLLSVCQTAGLDITADLLSFAPATIPVLPSAKGRQPSKTPKSWNDMTQDLGADEVLDYRTERFEQKYRDARFDVVLDVIGGAPSTAQQTVQTSLHAGYWPCRHVAMKSD